MTLIVVGAVIRIALLKSSAGVLDSDEAVVGLMARHFDMGQFRAFFWGQQYGGTVETFIVAALFKVFGSSSAALKIVPLGLYTVAAVLTWRVGARVMSRGAAIAAGLLIWIWPANYLWWSIKARGFYDVTLCITLGGALLILRIAEDERDHRVEWAALGLLAGIGWWQTPEVVYILAPAMVWLFIARRAALTQLPLAIPGFVIGALPWIVANLRSGFQSLVSPEAPIKGTYAAHLLTFARDGLPMTLGLKWIYTTVWIGSSQFGLLLYALGAAVVVVGCLREQRGSLLIGMTIAIYPFLHAILNQSGEVAEGRYTLFLLPWLAIALARSTQGRRIAVAALMIVALAVTATGLHDLRGQTSPYAPDREVPTSMAALIDTLDAQHIDRVWANYWIAYRLTFETGEHVIAASSLVIRYQPYNEAVSSAPLPAYIFIVHSRDLARFRAWLRVHHVDYDEWDIAQQWVVDQPLTRVEPQQVAGITA